MRPTPTTVHRNGALFLVLATSLAGCSGELSRTGSAPSTTLTPTTTPTAPTAPTPTSTTTPTPPPTAVSAAPTVSPSAKPRKRALDGDVDGDGEPDVVRATSTLITVTLSATNTKVTAPVHADSPAAPEVLGSTDVDRDGFAEVFLRTTQGASTSFATPYRYDGRSLRELQLDGQPTLLGFGGSAQHGDGFRCTDAGLVEVRKAEADSTGASYSVELTVYRLSATQLVRVRTSTTTAKQGSPEVEASYTVDCGSVGEGG